MNRELCVLSLLSLGYRPAIGCREWMKGLGAVTESLTEGQLNPGLGVLQLLLQIVQLLLRLHHRRAGRPRRFSLLSCSRWQRDRRSVMNVSWKFAVWFGVSKYDAFLPLGSSYWTSGPGARGKAKGPFSVFVFHVSLICILCTSHSDCCTGLGICVISHVL